MLGIVGCRPRALSVLHLASCPFRKDVRHYRVLACCFGVVRAAFFRHGGCQLVSCPFYNVFVPLVWKMCKYQSFC